MSNHNYFKIIIIILNYINAVLPFSCSVSLVLSKVVPFQYDLLIDAVLQDQWEFLLLTLHQVLYLERNKIIFY